MYFPKCLSRLNPQEAAQAMGHMAMPDACSGVWKPQCSLSKVSQHVCGPSLTVLLFQFALLADGLHACCFCWYANGQHSLSSFRLAGAALSAYCALSLQPCLCQGHEACTSMMTAACYLPLQCRQGGSLRIATIHQPIHTRLDAAV